MSNRSGPGALGVTKLRTSAVSIARSNQPRRGRVVSIKDEVDQLLSIARPADVDFVVIPIDDWAEFCAAVGKNGDEATVVEYRSFTCSKMAISDRPIIKRKAV